jgi:hypothetical protein
MSSGESEMELIVHVWFALKILIDYAIRVQEESHRNFD